MLRPSRSKLWKRRPLKKSPLKDNPLRNPGQSLDETIQILMDEDISAAIAVMMFCIVLTGYEWWRWYAQIPYHPWIMTLLCSGTILYCIFRLYTFKQQIKTLRLARDGEKAVGQYLESLRETGHRVFHDVIGNHFNLDHVIVGPKGIFTIETKTFSKPASGQAHIDFNGTTLTANGYRPDRNPITQSLAQANWLSELIKESTGHQHSVKPVVVFPGWFIRTSPEAKSSNVWVLNPKGLPKYLDNAAPKLSPEEVQLVAYHLSRYIRTHTPSL